MRRSPVDDRPLERAVLWSASFYRLFGATYGREQLPSELCPMSCGEMSLALDEIRKRQPHTVRHCLSQMLASGYIPDAHNADQFRGLVKQVIRGKPPEDAMADLRESGLRGYTGPSLEAVGAEPSVPRSAPRVPIPRPTVITFQGEVFTAKKQVLVPQRFGKVRSLVDPRNWKKLGPFWERKDGKEPIEEHWYHHAVGFKSGEVLEHFVVNWNRLRVQNFDARLKVTKRWNADMARTDYSLIHEERNELLVDQGYGEAKRIKGQPGWTCYTGEKTLKFSSNLLNLLAPGVMAMFLDGIVASFQKMFKPKPRRSARRQ